MVFRVGASLLALAVLVTACGDDDSTSPTTANIAGNWAYSASNVSGSGITCSISGATLTFTQTASTFTGITTGGNVVCSLAGQPFATTLAGQTVANGKVDGNMVAFDIGTSDVHNAGALSGNTITGTVTLHIVAGASTFNLSGNFSAAKQ